MIKYDEMELDDFLNDEIKELPDFVSEDNILNDEELAVIIDIDKRGRPVNPGRLAEMLMKKNPYVNVADEFLGSNLIFWWDNKSGVYKLINEDTAQGYIMSYLPIQLRQPVLLKNTLDLMLKEPNHNQTQETINPYKQLISFKNGTLNVNNGKFVANNPKFLITRQIECNYNPKAETPENFMKVVDNLCMYYDKNLKEWIVDEDQVKVIQEFFGLAISNFPALAKACLAITSTIGNTGKSALINALISLLNKKNVCSKNIQQLSAQFGTAPLLRARAAVIDDMSRAPLKDSSVIKQLTGGSPIDMERKGKDSITAYFDGLLIIASNGLPPIPNESGEHLMGRFKIIEATYVIPEKERDKTINEKIKKELDGIAVWALEGLQRYLANNNNFTRSERIEANQNAYARQNDVVAEFLYTRGYEVTLDEADRIRRKEFYEDFLLFCEQYNYSGSSKLNAKNFKFKMEQNKVGFKQSNGEWFTNVKKKEVEYIKYDDETIEKRSQVKQKIEKLRTDLISVHSSFSNTDEAMTLVENLEKLIEDFKKTEIKESDNISKFTQFYDKEETNGAVVDGSGNLIGSFTRYYNNNVPVGFKTNNN